MSQDNERCVKCGVLCGYDDGKGSWPGPNAAICGRCVGNLAKRFQAFFGITGISWGREGIEMEWLDVDKILSRITRNEKMRVSYIVTDKEFYQKTIMISQPVMEHKFPLEEEP